MTRVYNDPDALTKLLEEKERDLELAARIGQTLLDQNQSQNERINELEAELSQAKDKIIQLRHEISSKKDLLQIYLKDEEEAEEEEEEYEDDDDGMLHFSSLQYEALDQGRSSPSLSKRSSSRNAQLMVSKLERRVGTLETENRKLKSETLSRASELEDEERKELALIDECARRLTSTNKQVATLQEDLSRRTEETVKQAAEISLLTSQVASLEKTIRTLTTENEELESALSLAHECQSELSLELIDLKEKQANLLAAFHEKQEECRELAARRRSTLSDLLPYVDSLAYELEQSSSSPSSSSAHFHHEHHHPLHGANLVSNLDEMLCDEHEYDPAMGGFDGHHSAHHHHHLHHQCPTPDSLLSNDSFYTSSPFTSFSGPSTSAEQQQQPTSSQPQSQQSSSDAIITPASTTTLTSSTSPSPSPSSPSLTAENSTTSTSSTRPFKHRHHFLTDKLRYVKPLEGSQTLHQWRRLASPNLNNLFEERETKGYFSRIKANLAAAEVALYAATSKDRLPAPSSLSSSSEAHSSGTSAPPPTISITLAGSSSPTQSRATLHPKHHQPSLMGANFVTTNSVFTFTTTSVSQTRESVTHVTSTYSSVQPSTGKGNSSLPLSHCHRSAHTTAGGAQSSVTVATIAGQPSSKVRIW
ncbi:PREDICTED: trafficking kinesin-binding protein 1-like [Rhagoletis zephyria]|uniref:trafficking kinesin-binding protein 1-like n=1 Tax=Rhagoletis zephyria TaxID=28612 RepID=UPI000811594A|nr:PREDICTED: trafficking kinesin-binding protein 1-like [Rhagoletis zephyria]